MNLAQKIIEVRKVVKSLQKDTQGYGYKYVSEDKVLGIIRDKMDELGLLLELSVTGSTRSEYSYKNKQGHDKKENIIEGTMIFTWVDADSNEERQVPFVLYGQNEDASQAFGSGLTYSNRYFLLKYFQIATNENDPDKVTSKKKEEDEMNGHKKKELGKKLALECNDEQVKRVALDKLYAEFGWKDWNDVDITKVSEKAVIAKYVEFVKIAKDEIELLG